MQYTIQDLVFIVVGSDLVIFGPSPLVAVMGFIIAATGCLDLMMHWGEKRVLFGGAAAMLLLTITGMFIQ